MRHPGKRRTDCPATSSKCSVTAIWTEDDRARHPPPAGRRHDPNPRWPPQARPRSGADAIQARDTGIQRRIKGLPRGRHAMLPEPVREIKRARQYQQIMIRQRFIENTPHQRGGTSRFFHAHAYAENTSDIIVVGRTAMSRTRHRTPPPDHCHGCHSSHATHAIDMRTKQGGSSNRDVIPEGRQRPGEGQGGIGVHTRQPPTPPAGGLQRQRDLTQDQAQQDEIATYQNLDRRLDHNGRDGPCPHTSLTRRLFCVTILP